jgi:hypothetical protein
MLNFHHFSDIRVKLHVLSLRRRPDEAIVIIVVCRVVQYDSIKIDGITEDYFGWRVFAVFAFGGVPNTHYKTGRCTPPRIMIQPMY